MANFREAQEKYQESVVGLCCVCQKKVTGGFYGRWGDGGTCQKACETIQEAKPRYRPPQEKTDGHGNEVLQVQKDD